MASVSDHFMFWKKRMRIRDHSQSLSDIRQRSSFGINRSQRSLAGVFLIVGHEAGSSVELSRGGLGVALVMALFSRGG